MSNTSTQEPPGPELSVGSGQTLHSRPNQPISDPSTSKRVCFYKSGDYKFSGHRMVINGRTFKTYDALLDALSKKVPLPFGVRTITTPRGIHLVRTLDDLHDGGSYVCSDQKRVKPLNLEEVKRRQVPWNTTRPLSAGRRQRLQYAKKNEATNRPARVTERVAVRTPKKLVVISNRDPTFKRTIVLHRRSAPTFDALLDYLSQILQFPVLKLYSTDGRRVDGLAALILCAGVVVAAGNEPFKLGNYGFHRIGQITQAMLTDTGSGLQPKTQNNKSLSSGRGSRNFSISSERFIVEQVNKSRNGSMNSQPHHYGTSLEAETRHPSKSPRESQAADNAVNGQCALIVPHEDDIEKSFRVNEDGSMTVEMKVHLTIKEKEVLYWTTTLSRSSLSRKTVYASNTESAKSSPDSNNTVAKDSFNISEEETKEENCPAEPERAVAFNKKNVCEGYNPATEKAKPISSRIPTPGPRHVKKKASVESVTTVTSSGVTEHTLGHYSYMERMADGETTEGYCLIRHSSSSCSSNRPVPKPRKTVSAGVSKEGIHGKRPSGVAEVLKIENNGMEIRETVMHIYENQGCFDNYYANESYSSDHAPLYPSNLAADSNPSSNDCDIDISIADSLQRQGEEMLSLSSEPVNPDHTPRTVASSRKHTKTERLLKGEKKNVVKPSRNPKSLRSSSDQKKIEAVAITSIKNKNSSSDKSVSNKKNLTSSESAKSGKKSNSAEKSPVKPVKKGTRLAKQEEDILTTGEQVKSSPSQGQIKSKAGTGDNVNTPSVRPQLRKNISGILQPTNALLPAIKGTSQSKSMVRIASPKKRSSLTESFSWPFPLLPPCEVHQYVENWLEKITPDREPYPEEALADESAVRAKVEFQIGGDSEDNEQSEDYANELCRLALVSGTRSPLSSVQDDCMERQGEFQTHRFAKPILSEDRDASSLPSKEMIKPIMQHICSAVQSIKRASDTDIPASPDNINSTDKFSKQVASVFGSSCKLFLSFLSVMILQDYITGNQSRSTSEATLMMESLQKVSATEDEEEQRVSLEHLRNKASFQFKKSWKDFMHLSDRTETELTLSVKAVDVFEDQCLIIDELMGELNISQDLREVISLTVRLAPGFYPSEVRTPRESERKQSDKVIESEMEEKAGQGKVTEDRMVAHVQEEWDNKVEEEFVAKVQDEWGSLEPGETKVCEESEEELNDAKRGEDETNEETEQNESVEETEEKEELGVEVENEWGNLGAGDIEVSEESEEELNAQTGQDITNEVTEENTSVAGTEEKEEEELDVEVENELGSLEAGETETPEESEEESNAQTGQDMTNEETEENKSVEGIEEKEEEELDVNVESEWGGLEAGETETPEESEEESNAQTGQDTTNKETEENSVEETEEEEDTYIDDVEESHEVEERATESIEERDRNDEMQTESEDTNESEEKKTKKDVLDHVNLQPGEELVIREKTVEENKEDDTEEGGQEGMNTYEYETESDKSTEQEGRYDESNEVGNEELGDDRESGDGVEEGSETAGDLDTKTEARKAASKLEQNATDSPVKYSSEDQCEDDKRNGADTVTDDGEEHCEERSNNRPHPVELSQELLDFINSALQSSSLIFMYDEQGNVRLEPDNSQVVRTKQGLLLKRRKDSQYGLKVLPSPNTSDLSDYRPESSESWGSKPQESMDIATESGDDNSGNSHISKHKREMHNQKSNADRESTSAEAFQNSQVQIDGSVPSFSSGTELPREKLPHPVTEFAQCTTASLAEDVTDGVLIDRGRWLLKENHLIRKSPPVSPGMYANADSTSIDSGQENAEDAVIPNPTQVSPLTYISSSEIEELAKPNIPKCSYYNMPHGSESDPFMDDCSLKSEKNTSGGKRRGFRVSPTIDTSKTWASKNGSLSSFTSVEFKMPDGKVHPAEESSAMAQASRTSSGESRVLHARDSQDTLHLRCSQYCPIL